MSGDVQPRKRKDKKKKKDESDEGASIPGKTLSHSSSLGDGDAFIHVHHEGGTGGHWCAKIVFFSLLGVLIFLIGLILVENRGLTDLDIPATESRYAQMFDGWIDEGPLHDDHHDEHTLELKHEVDSNEEDVVDNSAREEELLEAKKAEQLAQEKEDSKEGKPSGGKSVQEDGETDDWVDDTSSDHWKEQLELAQAEMDEGRLEKAYRDFTALSLINQSCPLAKYGRAKALESMAELQRSNNLLDKAIEVFKELLNMKKINKKLFLDVSERAITKMRFRGKYIDAVPVHYMLIMKFPDVVKYRNDLAITYLMVNKVNMARKVLNETLSMWPDDGVALVHYGFILKTEDNDLLNGAKFMKKGIDIGGNGTLDGRFLFHLGDAYARLGNLDKANEIYELGASVGVFLSPVQRSLYNVNRLTGRPWWQPEQTPYTQLFKELEDNWKAISKEAKNLHSAYVPEQENLKDKGDWSQFQMFVRGREVNNNCKKCPVTCSIVKKELSAWNCRRGQIKFSAMHPGTHVFAHTGPTNCRIRAHLGLLGTEGTFIRVANETRSWETGKILIFDDSFDHEVWHNGTQLRIVLIVDLWHPELTKEERLTLPAI